MSQLSRRFTDQEVASILRRASEIEEREGRDASGALSERDLREIAREVGISPGAIDRALKEPAPRSGRSVLAGAPLVRRAVHEVPMELQRPAIARLVRLIEEQADEAGNVTEALGVVRWTAEDRFFSKQVAIAPENGRTRVQVVEKARPRIRRVVHLLPAAWGAMLAGPATAALDATGGLLALILTLGIVGGAAAGRVAWTWLSARSQSRVRDLAEALAHEAQQESPNAPSPNALR